MRGGVVLCVDASEARQKQICGELQTRLQSKGTPVFFCDEKTATTRRNRLGEFISSNNLEGLVAFCIWKTPVLESLRACSESAHLRSQAVSYYDIEFLLTGKGEERMDAAEAAVLVNLARIESADHVKDAVSKTVLSNTQVSRRDLFRSIPRILRVESNIPVILNDRCGTRSAHCDYCRDACHFNAITRNRQQLVIEDRLCVECGACARACPIGAIQCPTLSDAQMLAMLNTFAKAKWRGDQRTLILTCEIGADKFAAEMTTDSELKSTHVPVIVPCVGGIASEYSWWAASRGITLAAICPDKLCPKAKALAPAGNHGESYKKQLENQTANAEDRMQHHISLGKADSIVARASEIGAAEPNQGHSADLAGYSRREITLNAIKQFQTATERRDPLQETSTLPFFDLTVDLDKCSFCEACERVCPDHAIKFVKNETNSSFMFDTPLCGGCMVCEETCPEDALAISKLTKSSRLYQEGVEKGRDEIAGCASCGTTLGWNRGISSLERKFTKAGYSDLMIRKLRLCQRCKQSDLVGIPSYQIPPFQQR
jgi:ferredoxin